MRKDGSKHRDSGADQTPLIPEPQKMDPASDVAQASPSPSSPALSQGSDLASREVSAEARESAVKMRERTADMREFAAKVREAEASSRESASSAREKINADKEDLQNALEEHVTRLRDVNKRLVIANVNAQILTDQLQQAKTQMAHLAHHDYLTNLPNRIQLEDNLTQAIKFAKRHGTKLALLFMDLDRFKVVNDSLGHDIGDQLLQAVAQRLRTSVRDSDTVSRQGGDEFIVVLTDVGRLDELVTSVKKIHHIVTEPYVIAQHVLHIGASIGISLYPDDGADDETLLRHADAAMYAAKEGGRDNYAFFENAMNERAVARRQMEASLREAIARNEFVLHYQAQHDLKTGIITGAEALIRWRHPVDGLLYPAGFLPFAQECGAMLPIGRWVLRNACEQTRRWEDEGLTIDVIAVNLSAPEFESNDFLQYLLTVLHETGMAPHRLELELTESVLMRDCEATVQKLNTLRSLGVRVAVDDFGTGYSSLSYLKRFSIDTLKIDRSFVSDARSGIDEILVDAVITIGNRMQHQVIAEGIETAEQLEYLRAHQCTTGQGFHLGEPVNADDFTRMLKTHSQDQRRAPLI
ncbi:putative bifunctional diguanylate cyclase/phosphodiesterase [Noviherbaspirillum sp.]|uniref:putative bifunctional diguanylate cyclase/phosphodiesterase n=1 Tax=Noviherbaspirillum sp. TaxID=1926288 RepID=UPI002B4884BE|nr:EAL domain-containing protein [Noviherbaspirillum sp.]HJV80208.1 EAL domain-containing protein [Noviherbaspirillum sp.]